MNFEILKQYPWWVYYIIASLAIIFPYMIEWYKANCELKKQSKSFLPFDSKFFRDGLFSGLIICIIPIYNFYVMYLLFTTNYLQDLIQDMAEEEQSYNKPEG